MRAYLWRVLLSPIAWIIPLMALGFGAGLGARLGRTAGLVGVLVGGLLGFGVALVLFRAIQHHGEKRREERFRDEVLGSFQRPARSPGPIDPIAVGTGSVPPAQPVRVEIDVVAAAAELERKAATDLSSALVEAERLTRARPRDGRLAGLHARMLARAGRRGDACRVGSDAIQMCVLAGQTVDAVKVLTSLWEVREHLTFEAGTAVALAEALEASGESAQALWCAERAAAAGASSRALEDVRKRLSKP